MYFDVFDLETAADPSPQSDVPAHRTPTSRRRRPWREKILRSACRRGAQALVDMRGTILSRRRDVTKVLIAISQPGLAGAEGCWGWCEEMATAIWRRLPTAIHPPSATYAHWLCAGVRSKFFNRRVHLSITWPRSLRAALTLRVQSTFASLRSLHPSSFFLF